MKKKRRKVEVVTPLTEKIEKEEKYLSTYKAKDYLWNKYKLHVTINTLKKWCLDYNLGGKIGGRYKLNKYKLRRLVDDSLNNKEE